MTRVRMPIDKAAVQLRTRRRWPWFWRKERDYGPVREVTFTVTDRQTGILVPLYQREVGQRCVKNPYVARDGRLRAWVNAPASLTIETSAPGIVPATQNVEVIVP